MSDTSGIFHSLLRCPNCGSHVEVSTAKGEVLCASCNTGYFFLGDTICMFPAGQHQKAIWEHQAGTMQARGEHGLSHLQETISRYDLSSTTRQRLLDNYEALALSQRTTLTMLREVGIEAQLHPQMQHVGGGDLTEYWDLILRDWAWDRCSGSEYSEDENAAATDRLTNVAKGMPKPGAMLVLGAGAGRLSWDLHCRLRSECTVALDTNPVMLTVADHLIKQQRPLALGEFKTFPQVDCAPATLWEVPAVADPDNRRHSWFALAADAWQAPLQPHSFDIIVTPWFIDVNGGDLRDTIALISRLLKPGGQWLNTGPLLFSRDLPLQIKYQASEVKEFLALSGFELKRERVDEACHLASHLEVRRRYEQLWTFCATAPIEAGPIGAVDGVKAAWLVMHHLPVPKGPYRAPQKHPLIDAILGLIDGQRSINDLCWTLAPEMPEGIPPKDVIVTLLGQILEETSAEAD